MEAQNEGTVENQAWLIHM